MRDESPRSPPTIQSEDGRVPSTSEGLASPSLSTQETSQPFLPASLAQAPARSQGRQASQSQQPPSIPAHQRRRRAEKLNKFACFTCQKKKTKCDGVRPLCGACVKRIRRYPDIECKYPVDDPGASSRLSCLRDRYQELIDLFNYLSSPAETEAFEVYRRLRMNTDPHMVIQQLRDADSFFALPSLSGSGMAESEIQKMDADALATSIIKVPARPWTSLAGDGLVSNLISAYFKWDNPMFSFWIDRELFVRDMRSVDPTRAQYCSRFLVNAICAYRAKFCSTADAINRAAKINLSTEFFEEAIHHLDLEGGRPSLPTMHGLFIIQIMLSSSLNTRTAMCCYRLRFIDMISRLRLEDEFTSLTSQGPTEVERRGALSKAYWGIFCCECLFSHLTLQAHAVKPPVIPCVFDYRTDSAINVDLFGVPFGFGSADPPMVGAAQPTKNQVCILHYRVMEYNTSFRAAVGTEVDMVVRRAFFQELADLDKVLPPHLHHRTNLTPQTLNLRMYMNFVAYAIVRPLHVDTVVQPGYTARSILMDLCAVDTELAEHYFHRFGLREYTPAIVPGVWGVLFTVLPSLNDPTASNLFIRACHLLRMVYQGIPQMRNAMFGVVATAHELGQQIPREALQYFGDFEQVNPSELNGAAPAGTAFPAQKEVKGLVALDGSFEGASPKCEWGLVVTRNQ